MSRQGGTHRAVVGDVGDGGVEEAIDEGGVILQRKHDADADLAALCRAGGQLGLWDGADDLRFQRVLRACAAREAPFLFLVW